MAHVFISYSRTDAEKVKLLIQALKGLGLTVTHDGDFERAENFVVRVVKEIREAGVVVVCWSAAAAASEDVLGEANDALRLNKYLGCQIAEGQAPYKFGLNNHDNLTKWTGDTRRDRTFLSFVSEIGRRLGKDEFKGLLGAEDKRIADEEQKLRNEEDERKRKLEIARQLEAARIHAAEQRQAEAARRELERRRSFVEKIQRRIPDPRDLYWWNPLSLAVAVMPIGIGLFYVLAAIARATFRQDSSDTAWWIAMLAPWLLVTVIPWLATGGVMGGWCAGGALCGFEWGVRSIW